MKWKIFATTKSQSKNNITANVYVLCFKLSTNGAGNNN